MPLSMYQWEIAGYCKHCHCPIFWSEDEDKYRFTNLNCMCELDNPKKEEGE